LVRPAEDCRYGALAERAAKPFEASAALEHRKSICSGGHKSDLFCEVIEQHGHDNVQQKNRDDRVGHKKGHHLPRRRAPSSDHHTEKASQYKAIQEAE
jgi:hypothetical protein